MNKEANVISYYSEKNSLRSYDYFPRPAHATISVLTFRRDKLLHQDEYLENSTTNYSVIWLKEKNERFENEWELMLWRLNAQFHNRGKNIVMECLQFGGNTEFWHTFKSEKDILSYFKKCYQFAIRTIGYLHTDENILCACIIQEENRKNLFVYYLPITERWNVKIESDRLSEKGHRLQLRNEYDQPIYKSQHNPQKPLLSHSEFWKQRGDMQSYSLLQENFFNQVSQLYGAKRGESHSLLIHTVPEQKQRFSRHEGDEYDIPYFDDSPY